MPEELPKGFSKAIQKAKESADKAYEEFQKFFSKGRRVTWVRAGHRQYGEVVDTVGYSWDTAGLLVKNQHTGNTLRLDKSYFILGV